MGDDSGDDDGCAAGGGGDGVGSVMMNSTVWLVPMVPAASCADNVRLCSPMDRFVSVMFSGDMVVLFVSRQ